MAFINNSYFKVFCFRFISYSFNFFISILSCVFVRFSFVSGYNVFTIFSIFFIFILILWSWSRLVFPISCIICFRCRVIICFRSRGIICFLRFVYFNIFKIFYRFRIIESKISIFKKRSNNWIKIKVKMELRSLSIIIIWFIFYITDISDIVSNIKLFEPGLLI